MSLLGVLQHWRDHMHSALEPAETRLFNDLLQTTRAALAPDVWQTRWHQGQTLDVDTLLLT